MKGPSISRRCAPSTAATPNEGLDPGFPDAWRSAAADPVFQAAQEAERDRVYFDPAVWLAKQDGLRALGQFACYDAAVMHGAGGRRSSAAEPDRQDF